MIWYYIILYHIILYFVILYHIILYIVHYSGLCQCQYCWIPMFQLHTFYTVIFCNHSIQNPHIFLQDIDDFCGSSRLSGRGHQRRQAQWLLLQAGDVTLHLAAKRLGGWLLWMEDSFSRLGAFCHWVSLNLTESHNGIPWNSMEFHSTKPEDGSFFPTFCMICPAWCKGLNMSQPAGSYSNAQPAINGYHHWSYWYFFPHFAWKTNSFLHQWSHKLLAVSSYIEASNVSGVPLQ